jgi:hypothetical protein
LHAQNKIFTGYFVDNKGDTIKGSFPKYSQWSKNPNKVQFLVAGNSNTIQLSPENCMWFSVDGYDEYISYTGRRLLNPIDDNVAVDNTDYFNFEDRDTSIVVFLRVVIKTPKCNIYVLNDNLRTNLFYQLPGGSLQELKFKKYFDENNLHEMDEYRQQLNNMFTQEISNNHLAKSLEELPYTEEGLTRFLKNLFQIKSLKEGVNNSRAGCVISAGASINFLHGAGDASMDEVKHSYPASSAPFLSVGFVFPIKRSFNRYFIYPQLRLYSYKSSTQFRVGRFTEKILFQSKLVILPQLNVGGNIVNKESFQFFLYGGVGTLLFINNKEVDQNIITADGKVYNFTEYLAMKLTYSGNLSIGIRVRSKWSIQTAYHFPTPTTNFNSYTAMHSALQLGVGYQFR